MAFSFDDRVDSGVERSDVHTLPQPPQLRRVVITTISRLDDLRVIREWEGPSDADSRFCSVVLWLWREVDMEAKFAEFAG